jgi:phosphoribosylaminoimidazole carboxylase (NCAIR synthetase)
MAMECFVTPDGLLINELAPRVHNSGQRHAGAQNAVLMQIVRQRIEHRAAIMAARADQRHFQAQQQQAEAMLSAIMQELNYVGVMAMECFVTPDGFCA